MEEAHGYTEEQMVAISIGVSRRSLRQVEVNRIE
jgi:hypothetical protein